MTEIDGTESDKQRKTGKKKREPADSELRTEAVSSTHLASRRPAPFLLLFFDLRSSLTSEATPTCPPLGLFLLLKSTSLLKSNRTSSPPPRLFTTTLSVQNLAESLSASTSESKQEKVEITKWQMLRRQMQSTPKRNQSEAKTKRRVRLRPHVPTQLQRRLPHPLVPMSLLQHTQLEETTSERIANLRIVHVSSINSVRRSILRAQQRLDLRFPHHQSRHELDRFYGCGGREVKGC